MSFEQFSVSQSKINKWSIKFDENENKVFNILVKNFPVLVKNDNLIDYPDFLFRHIDPINIELSWKIDSEANISNILDLIASQDFLAELEPEGSFVKEGCYKINLLHCKISKFQFDSDFFYADKSSVNTNQSYRSINVKLSLLPSEIEYIGASTYKLSYFDEELVVSKSISQYLSSGSEEKELFESQQKLLNLNQSKNQFSVSQSKINKWIAKFENDDDKKYNVLIRRFPQLILNADETPLSYFKHSGHILLEVSWEIDASIDIENIFDLAELDDFEVDLVVEGSLIKESNYKIRLVDCELSEFQISPDFYYPSKLKESTSQKYRKIIAFLKIKPDEIKYINENTLEEYDLSLYEETVIEEDFCHYSSDRVEYIPSSKENWGGIVPNDVKEALDALIFGVVNVLTVDESAAPGDNPTSDLGDFYIQNGGGPRRHFTDASSSAKKLWYNDSGVWKIIGGQIHLPNGLFVDSISGTTTALGADGSMHNAFSDLSEAMSAANVGTCIYIAPGIYSESNFVWKSGVHLEPWAAKHYLPEDINGFGFPIRIDFSGPITISGSGAALSASNLFIRFVAGTYGQAAITCSPSANTPFVFNDCLFNTSVNIGVSMFDINGGSLLLEGSLFYSNAHTLVPYSIVNNTSGGELILDNVALRCANGATGILQQTGSSCRTYILNSQFNLGADAIAIRITDGTIVATNGTSIVPSVTHNWAGGTGNTSGTGTGLSMAGGTIEWYDGTINVYGGAAIAVASGNLYLGELVTRGTQTGTINYFPKTSDVYTPADLTNWNGSLDPGDINEALDQLADRTTNIEENFTKRTIVSKTSTYTAVPYDIILCDTSGGGFTINLPPAANATNKIITIKKISVDGLTLTIEADGTETIDGDLMKQIVTTWTSMDIVSDGNNWYIT